MDIYIYIFFPYFDITRITKSRDMATVQGLFQYLEDNTVIKDKAGMWTCIDAVANVAFRTFLKVKKSQVYSLSQCSCPVNPKNHR